MAEIKIVCLGDSTTYGFPYGPEHSWTSMLAEQINGKVINKGINGNTTEDMLRRFKRDVLDLKPDYVIITGGINDVVQGESLAAITFNIENMVREALAQGIKVVLGLPTPVDYPAWEKVLQNLRDWLVQLAKSLNLPVIDFSKAFYDENHILKKHLLLPDGGHPTREGYKAMFAQIDLNLFI
ncbi:Lysophospholipase L1 [Thermosyntropha lipolytica DSM 11003]|uniref:Lysophospholipase L1 n=1 Tax=Thermosyntropha lipolytica DSM 11003 TaxID=1123382 RepID=A0A1M5LC63_9FIRM|nr:SGNH/GDSL hydrolase family protein [Thermosyntropha lipolytica]SHG62013.1 Lysophospholipase L1 [Thermosyntropha lipolytica DSM 11003]